MKKSSRTSKTRPGLFQTIQDNDDRNSSDKTFQELTPKRELFCKYYTDRSNKQTFLNGRQSAIKAGFAQKYPQRYASILLTDVNVSRHIEHMLKNQVQNERVTKETAIEEARQEYIKAENDKERRNWFNTWCQLSGFLIERKEVEHRMRLTQEEMNQVLEYKRRVSRETSLNTNSGNELQQEHIIDVEST